MVVPGDLLVGVLFPDPELAILGVLYGNILGGNVTQRRVFCCLVASPWERSLGIQREDGTSAAAARGLLILGHVLLFWNIPDLLLYSPPRISSLRDIEQPLCVTVLTAEWR